ncbi:MAG: hypothetical protein ACKOXJ_05145, partial [Alphaproteobacteria bacterium]
WRLRPDHLRDQTRFVGVRGRYGRYKRQRAAECRRRRAACVLVSYEIEEFLNLINKKIINKEINYQL